MNQNNNLKEQLLNRLNSLLDEKIETAKQEIELIKDARDNETKNSVGDKYETAHAMLQMELEKYQSQLAKMRTLKKELEQINPQKTYTTAEFGSLVVCNSGNYFLSIGMGKIELGKENYYCLSTISPIGQALLGKTTSDEVQFQGKTIIIQKIV
ncbi:MAG TPA: hypothetical protein VKA27_09705 [Sunxiuqinia sp.]|nr:hypothetical protein [Sunxiuqinia sp.]